MSPMSPMSAPMSAPLQRYNGNIHGFVHSCVLFTSITPSSSLQSDTFPADLSPMTHKTENTDKTNETDETDKTENRQDGQDGQDIRQDRQDRQDVYYLCQSHGRHRRKCPESVSPAYTAVPVTLGHASQPMTNFPPPPASTTLSTNSAPDVAETARDGQRHPKTAREQAPPSLRHFIYPYCTRTAIAIMALRVAPSS
ncbi:hypothetical protein K504DRAFT_450124 [Pleomassaria siparia CBS 279.74]|uniref:Uncharacterized protein n=1 Tax=Pleomassaria siparia CBS 279.74 TaxID=1314801 RepID=A0A6G1KLK2_9PLEO|nr:hypothetical protein K504DRAFT_450124 [Pleomassaria siparia CBS 279.74]